MRKPRRTRFSAATGRIAEIGNPYGNPAQTDSPPSASSSPEVLDDGQDFDRSQADAETEAAPSGSSGSPPSWLRFLTSRRPQSANQRPVGLLAIACLVLGLLGGYEIGRRAGSPTPTRGVDNPPEGTTRLAAGELKRLDAAYTARYTHHFAEAEQLFTALGLAHPEWPIMKVELGRTMVYGGRLEEARKVLNNVVIAGTTNADAHFALGLVNLVEKNFREAESSMAAAVATDPTRPDFYFLWGDCLRDQGRMIEAAEKFDSALLRNSYETADGLYHLKLWLSEIDANLEKGNGLGEKIDAALARPSPSMETLFAAAARDLKAGDFAAAAGHIRRARERTDPVVYHVIMNDPTFDLVRRRPELADLFGTELTASIPPAQSPLPPSAPSPIGK